MKNYMSIENDFFWVKRCIESCVQFSQLKVASNLKEAYSRKWKEKSSFPFFKFDLDLSFYKKELELK
jgi:hypothetical protein